MLLPSPVLAPEPTTLVPEGRVVKGFPDRLEEEPLATRIRLGGPVCTPLEAGGVDDPDVAARLRAEQGSHEYTTIDIAPTFNPADGERIHRAWVQVLLSVEGRSADAAIAWSMAPERLASPVSVHSGVEVKANLKLVVVGMSRALESERAEVSLSALNILRQDPTWEFSRTSSVEIDGPHRLVLMVRSPAGASVRGRVVMAASIGRRHLKVFPYRVQLGTGTTHAEGDFGVR